MPLQPPVFEAPGIPNGDLLLDNLLLVGKPLNTQRKFMELFSLTDEFRDAYGRYVLRKFPKSKVVKDMVAAIEQYKKVKVTDLAEYEDLLADLIYTRNILRFFRWEYFCYDFEHKSISERIEYLSGADMLDFYTAISTDPRSSKALNNKYLTWEALKPYYKRDMARYEAERDIEKLQAFLSAHARFIVKPMASNQGTGVHIVSAKDFDSQDALISYLIGLAPVVCEELIVQHDSLGQFHPASVNSLRVTTYYNGRDVRLVYPRFKCGSGGSSIDNLSSGGMMACIDPDTGIITTDAWTEEPRRYIRHPDTGLQFRGFQIPDWGAMCDIVTECAREFHYIPLVSWDVALSVDMGWQVVEGNLYGGMTGVQLALERGIRRELTDIIEMKRRIAACRGSAKNRLMRDLVHETEMSETKK